MIKNYFKIAWRTLLKNKTFTAINIVGLTVGLSCCLLMVMYLQFELSFDKFHSKSDRLVRVIMKYSIGGAEGAKGNFTSAKVFPTFKENFPEVENGVRMMPTQRLVNYGDKTINEPNFVFADSTFFSLFDFPLLRGNAADVLNEPNSIVISESAAQRYFGKEDPINKTVQIGSRQDKYVIKGVSEDCPKNSQLTFDFLASISSFGGLPEDTYWNANYTTYLLLNNAESVEPLQAKITPFMRKEMANNEGVELDYVLEPFSDIHLRSEFDAITPNTNILYIYIIAGMAVLLLVIACFTYINLSTARSVERAKEVGVRKSIGARKSQLFWQFISESVLVTSLSLVLSIVLASLLVPVFNDLSGMEFSLDSLIIPEVLGVGLLLFFVIAFLAGSYPALVLTGFNPVSVLKGSFRTSRGGVRLGQSLTVFQFGISIFLIISTIVISRQMSYIQNKKLGFEKANSILLETDGKMFDKMDLIKAELSRIPNVMAVSNSYDSPLNIRGGYNMSNGDDVKNMAVTANPIDENFVKACGIKLIAGEDISLQDVKDASSEENPAYNYILNVSGARALGWSPQEAIGKKMYMDESRPGVVKGVVEDFHFASLHTPIKPLVLFPSIYNGTMIIRTAGQNTSQTLAAIGAKLKELAPHRPFEYKFMDDEYRKMYASEQRTAKIFNIFSSVAMLLACLGLFGLSTYAIKQRIKEIGVRKVLGASVTNLTMILSGNFLKLVGIAFVITMPLAFWGMSQWLENFAYRVEISWWIYAVSGLIAMAIALLTVSFQAIKAALLNPVETLKTE